MNSSPRHFGLDLLRIGCIVAVVFTHVNTIIASPTQFTGGLSWWIASFLHAFAQPAVPLFFMLSGFTLIQKNETLKQSFKRVLWRILVPLLVWHVFSMLWSVAGLDRNHSPFSILKAMFLGGYNHLYFLWQLAFVYVCMPLFRTFRARTHALFSGVFFLVGCSVQLLILQNLLVAPVSVFASLCIPFAHANLGAWLFKQNHVYNYKKLRLALLLFSLFATTFLSFEIIQTYVQHGTIFWSIANGNAAYYPTQPFVFLSAFLVFGFFVQFQLTHPPRYISIMVQFLTSVVFGIYLIHPFILQYLDLHFLADIDRTTLPLLIWLGAKCIIVLGLSTVASYVLTSIPILQKSVGKMESQNRIQ